MDTETKALLHALIKRGLLTEKEYSESLDFIRDEIAKMEVCKTVNFNFTSGDYNLRHYQDIFHNLISESVWRFSPKARVCVKLTRTIGNKSFNNSVDVSISFFNESEETINKALEAVEKFAVSAQRDFN